MRFKIPNYLTIGRIIIVPIFVITFYLPGFYGDIIPFAIFVIASFTDFLDGLLARMYKEESKLGELLDPIADKIIVATALILLVMDGTIKNYEVIAAIIILIREILRFDDVILEVEEELLPNRLCNYLYELSQNFNRFYDQIPVLKAKEPSKSSRLLLCRLTGDILKKGLNLLGIDTLERM